MFYPVKYRVKTAAVHGLDLQMLVKMVTCHPIPIITSCATVFICSLCLVKLIVNPAVFIKKGKNTKQQAQNLIY